MVRQVNLLSLRAWGTSVCAVKSEDEAISRLKLRSESSIPVLLHVLPEAWQPGKYLSLSSNATLSRWSLVHTWSKTASYCLEAQSLYKSTPYLAIRLQLVASLQLCTH